MTIYQEILKIRDELANLLLWPEVPPILATIPLSAANWLLKNIVGVGAANSDIPVLQLYVKATIPAQFHRFTILPPFVAAIIKGVPFRVLETGPFQPVVGGPPAGGGMPPSGGMVQAGARIRLGSGPVGTLCAFVNIGSDVHLISCSHVLHGAVNQGVRVGGNVVAALSQKVDLLPAGPGTVTKADCARALLAPGFKPVPGLPNGLGRLTSATPATPTYGNAVRQAGQNATTGKIEDTSAHIKFEFIGIEAGFENQILISGDHGPFAKPGDSGSLVVDVSQAGQILPLGMTVATSDTTGLVGGNPTEQWTAVCPLRAVLDALGAPPQAATLMI